MPKGLVTVVEDPPCGSIIGAAFLKRNGSVVNFETGGSFKPAPESPWVPFLSSTEAPSSKKGERAADWQEAARPDCSGTKSTAITSKSTLEKFCSVRPPGGDEYPEEIAEPPTKPNMGSVGWEDNGTLQWELRPTRQVLVPVFVSVQADAYAKGVQPQNRQLVVVKPTAPYDMEAGAKLGVARATQWWHPGTPLQYNMANRCKASLTLKRGKVVARIYAVNTSGRERLNVL